MYFSNNDFSITTLTEIQPQLMSHSVILFYTEMETTIVLRLAHLHNQTDRVYHEMNTREKVNKLAHLLLESFLPCLADKLD